MAKITREGEWTTYEWTPREGRALLRRLEAYLKKERERKRRWRARKKAAHAAIMDRSTDTAPPVVQARRAATQGPPVVSRKGNKG
jgi:hypothetical protein